MAPGRQYAPAAALIAPRLVLVSTKFGGSASTRLHVLAVPLPVPVPPVSPLQARPNAASTTSPAIGQRHVRSGVMGTVSFAASLTGFRTERAARAGHQAATALCGRRRSIRRPAITRLYRCWGYVQVDG